MRPENQRHIVGENRFLSMWVAIDIAAWSYWSSAVSTHSDNLCSAENRLRIE